ncbi:MAG TPA: hypothetical protein VD978_31475 [Azospirillum sp.]|nr:hypothetical protein [Azospirillum sp.]
MALRLGHHPDAAGTADRMTLTVIADAAAVVIDLEPGGELHRLMAAQARVRMAMRIRAEFADAEPDEDTTWN